MNYRITKLFAVNGRNHEVSTEVILERDKGQVRKVSGQIGTRMDDGSYVTSVNGEGELIITLADPCTTLHIEAIK